MALQRWEGCGGVTFDVEFDDETQRGVGQSRHTRAQLIVQHSATAPHFTPHTTPHHTTPHHSTAQHKLVDTKHNNIHHSAQPKGGRAVHGMAGASITPTAGAGAAPSLAIAPAANGCSGFAAAAAAAAEAQGAAAAATAGVGVGLARSCSLF
jgi:hypothetical protein